MISFNYKVLSIFTIHTKLDDQGITVRGTGRKIFILWDQIQHAGLVTHQKFDYSKEHSEFLEVLPPFAKGAMDLNNSLQRILIVYHKRNREKVLYLSFPIEKSEKILEAFRKNISGFIAEPTSDRKLRKLFNKRIPLVIQILSIIGCYLFAILILIIWFVILYVTKVLPEDILGL